MLNILTLYNLILIAFHSKPYDFDIPDNSNYRAPPYDVDDLKYSYFLQIYYYLNNNRLKKSLIKFIQLLKI